MAVNIKMNDKSINLGDKVASKGKKRPKKKLLIIATIIVLLFSTLLLGGYYLTQRAGVKFGITDIFNPIKANPQLERDSSGKYTNALLVGIDSRGENSGLLNTDTIILVSYNYDDKNAVMTSIPRDFFVKVPDQERYTKINSIYAIGERIEPGSGLDYLQRVVEDMTGKEIQYHGMINLVGFVDLIDIIGGIEVDVENSFTDYRYPVEGAESRYQTISFQKGLQTMDGKTALRFVRSRYSMDAHEGSDFARARRQQRVLTAVREELLSSSTYLNPRKILDVAKILENNIKFSEFTNEEIQAGLKLVQKEGIETYSFVLDPSIAKFKIITDKGLAGNGYTITPTAGLNRYEEIQKYIYHAHKKPTLYSEDPTILVYDIGIGYNEALEKTQKFQERHPYIQIQYMGTLMSDMEGNYFYSLSELGEEIDEKIAKNFSMNLTQEPEFIQQQIPNGDYIILLGSND